MKRMIDVCNGCSRMISLRKGSDGSDAGVFCCSVQSGSDICRFLENMVGLKLNEMRAEDSAMMTGGHWEQLDVPNDCDRYEHYFLLECNK